MIRAKKEGVEEWGTRDLTLIESKARDRSQYE